MNIKELEQKAKWVWCESLRVHKTCQETRIASSISCIETLVALYYGEILKFDPKTPDWEERDRFIVSKGHGSISFYPILADLGFITRKDLHEIGKPGALLKAIPDPHIPGYETVNGSLGHGIGVGAGMSLALKHKGNNNHVFVLAGDGEMNEGAMWEGIMMAGHHCLSNLCVIVDDNKQGMLDYSCNVLQLSPFSEKFKAFGWDAEEVDGHDISQLLTALKKAKDPKRDKPLAIIANTVKGRGVSCLEGQPLCHIFNVNGETVDSLVQGE